MDKPLHSEPSAQERVDDNISALLELVEHPDYWKWHDAAVMTTRKRRERKRRADLQKARDAFFRVLNMR